MHVMLDNTYAKVNTMRALGGARSGINGHEFTIFDRGTRALHFASRDRSFNETQATNHSLTVFGIENAVLPGHYQDNCIVQTHIESGAQEFEWCALDNGISPQESMDTKGYPAQKFPWDYLLVSLLVSII